jgi:hypothetical protein
MATYSKALKANSLQAAKVWQSAKTAAYVAFTLQALDALNWGEGQGKKTQDVQNALRMVMFDANIGPTDRSRVSSTAVRLASKIGKHYPEHKLIVAAKGAADVAAATEALTSFLSGIGVKAAYQFEAWAKSGDPAALSKAASKAALADKVGGQAKAAAAPSKDDAKSEETGDAGGEGDASTLAVIDTSEKALAVILPAIARLNNRDLKRLEDAILARRQSLTEAAKAKRAAKAGKDLDGENRIAA